MATNRHSSVMATSGGPRTAGRWMVWLAAAALVCALPGWAQLKDYKDTYGKKKDDHTRSVTGLVTGPDGNPVVGAVVQLKNTKTLEIRSYITQDNGKYSFNELSSDVDYELKAFDNRHGASSPTKSLSSFDSRKQAILDLKLSKK